MTLDKKTIVVLVQLVIIVILIIILFNTGNHDLEEKDEYINKLITQNQELEHQLSKLKRNYVEIGLADSLETRNIDSLIAVSGRKITGMFRQIDESRVTLEEMKKNRWDKLSETQIDKEIQEAINYLKTNENNN